MRLIIDACLLTKIVFLLSTMSTKIDFAEQQVMTITAGKRQQPRKQEASSTAEAVVAGRQRQDIGSGDGGNIGTTMTATTGNGDYDVDRV